MTAIALIGLLLFLFSLIYLIVHFLRKIKHSERTLSKKIFYLTFIGGLLLSIIGASFMDTGTQEQLDEALATNTTLTAKNKDLKAINKKLQETNDQLSKDNKKLNKELEKLKTKISDAKKAEKEFNDQKVALDKEKDGLNKQISELETKNESLNNEIDSLKEKLASAESEISSSNNMASSNSNSSNSSLTSSTREDFANCTELRGTYPNGVPAGHPAYVPSMDRDKDGYACER